jgi:hypothetical protein
MKRACTMLLAMTTSLVCLAGPVSAKGHFPTRAYAVLTGPGLAHPIVFAAPWKKSLGGYYGEGEADRFLGLAEGTGALPAGRLQTESGDYVRYGVLPIDDKPSVADFTPRYRLTWFRDGVDTVAVQDIYPYAAAGPVVYTHPSSRRALIVLFGRFQSPADLWTGWGRATTFDLRKFLQYHGLPTVAPEVHANSTKGASGAAPTSTHSALPMDGQVQRTSQPTRMPPFAVSAAVVLVVVSAIALWTRRRRKSHRLADMRWDRRHPLWNGR